MPPLEQPQYVSHFASTKACRQELAKADLDCSTWSHACSTTGLQCMHMTCTCGCMLQDLHSHVYGNPHSLHGELLGEPGSSAAESEARRLTLDMCNAPPGEYVCIFTSGATGVQTGQ